ncbi:heavy metal-binding domain-containing protein [Streptomyces sp. NPDC054865]
MAQGDDTTTRHRPAGRRSRRDDEPRAGGIRSASRNVEIEPFTQALHGARELALGRMRAEAEALDAEGIVAVRPRQHSHSWGPHTTEFFAVGTAVRPLRDDHTIDRPSLVLSLDD